MSGQRIKDTPLSELEVRIVIYSLLYHTMNIFTLCRVIQYLTIFDTLNILLVDIKIVYSFYLLVMYSTASFWPITSRNYVDLVFPMLVQSIAVYECSQPRDIDNSFYGIWTQLC